MKLRLGGSRWIIVQEPELLKAAAKLPSLALPVVHSPTLDLGDAEALLEELARRNKQSA